MVVSKDTEEVVDGLLEKSEWMSGEAASQKAADQPTHGIPGRGAPLSSEHQCRDWQAKLIPGTVNPGGERDQDDAKDHAAPARASVLEAEPDKNESKENSDGEQIRSAQKKAINEARNENGDDQKRREPSLGPAKARKNYRAEEDHQSDDRDEDE